MTKEDKIIIIIGIIIFVVLMTMMVIEGRAEMNCQEYETKCYERARGFWESTDTETRCGGDRWDYKKEVCTNPGYFWEDSGSSQKTGRKDGK